MALASALQRLPVETRWPIAEALASHAEDADDTPLVLMTWYGLEPLVPADRERAVSLVERMAIPKLRQFLTRRIIATDLVMGLAVLLPKTETADDLTRRDLLSGMHAALRGRKHVSAPESWTRLFDLLSLSKDASVRELAAMLGLLFGDANATEKLLLTLGSSTAEVVERRRGPGCALRTPSGRSGSRAPKPSGRSRVVFPGDPCLECLRRPSDSPDVTESISDAQRDRA